MNLDKFVIDTFADLWKQSPDPEAETSRNEHFQAGYKAGEASQLSVTGGDYDDGVFFGKFKEFGSDHKHPDWRQWKIGYHAARWNRVSMMRRKDK